MKTSACSMSPRNAVLPASDRRSRTTLRLLRFTLTKTPLILGSGPSGSDRVLSTSGGQPLITMALMLDLDREGVFPHEFYKSLVEGGWLGIAMPAEFGGSGLGITEAAVMMQAIAESGAAMSGASSVHMPVFSLQPIVLFGTQEQKERILPPVVR